MVNIVRLTPDAQETPERSGAGADHPMRGVTEAVLADRSKWDNDQRDAVRQLFDELSSTWTEDRVGNTARIQPISDGLVRGVVNTGRCLDLGAGTGLGTEILQAHFREVVSVDLSHSMLVNAVIDVNRLQADGATLPFPDNAFDCVALVNMILFPEEVDRVLAPSGAVLWVSSRGDQTPIFLTDVAVAEALPGSWHGVASQAGTGTWCVLRRDTDVSHREPSRRR
jgi:SAM-dependent methyltransferase